ncbi:T9SS type A sorting domain-containing protein, partial [Vibrio sp.]|uniref:T9SS type A sorting domain-containing protein n=1 Tax=Vibrio sp. TaxID=678 RepID=UPI003D0F42E1
TEVGLTDTFAMNLPGTIHAECEEEEITLWARLNQGDYISTTDDSLEFTPDNVGNVQAIISKSGYNLYEEIYPVIIAYGTVAGTVTSMEGDPLSEVEVRFYNAGAIPDSTEPIAMAETNSSGIYEVSEELPVDYYDIYIEEFGFMPYQELNYFLAYGENEHDIMLEPSPQITFHGRIYDENGPVTGSKIVYSLSDTGEPYDTVDVPMSRYSASLPIFTYDVYVSCPGHVPFRGELEVNAELLSVDYELGIAALFSDFEEDDGEFSPTPSTNAWEWGEPTAGGISAYSGVNLWATNLEGYYGVDNADWYLDSPSFTVPDSGRLYFYHYYNFEGSKGEKTLWDGGNVKLSMDGGPFTLITPVGGYDGTIIGLGESGFGGTSDGWEQVEFDLEDYAGQEVILRWHFGSDTSVNNYYGWYIDDVLVGDPTNSSQYANYNPDSVPSEPQSENIFALYQNYPNPVADQTTIRFALPTNINKAELSIYNIKGQLVKRFELDSGSKEPVKWDTTDMQGKSVANGIYFYKLSTEKAEAVKKMIVIR